jgi:hypothetical protein
MASYFAAALMLFMDDHPYATRLRESIQRGDLRELEEGMAKLAEAGSIAMERISA